MNSQLVFRNVSRSLTRFKARAVLGALGIVVSVLATVSVLSLSGTFRSSAQAFLSSIYPSDVVVVNAGNAGFMGGGSGAQNMRMRDMEAVAASVPEIVAWDISNFGGPREIRSETRTTRVIVMGTGAQAPAVRRVGVSEGAYVDEADVDSRARVALIGATAQRELFGAASPVGTTIFIENMPFTVKGVLARRGASLHGDDQDNVIVVPYTVVMDSLLKIDFARQVAYQIGDPARVEVAAQSIAAVMRRQHGIGEGRVDDFSVVVPKQMQAMMERTLRTIWLFSALICVACFLVSALVVLGVMNVSVRQRVPELGLRKAVGADASDVRKQILLEALVIAAVACAVGALLAWVCVSIAAPMLSAKFGINGVRLTGGALLVGVVAALATGLVGAWWPAHRAAKLRRRRGASGAVTRWLARMALMSVSP